MARIRLRSAVKAVWFDLEARLRLYRLAAVAMAGRGFWLLPALPLCWLLVLGVASALGLRGGHEPVTALFVVRSPAESPPWRSCTPTAGSACSTAREPCVKAPVLMIQTGGTGYALVLQRNTHR